jgi:cytochrome c oxidase subunit II
MRKIYLFILSLIMSATSYADAPKPWQIDFQDAATPVMERIVSLHDFLMIVMTSIVIVVMFLLAYVCLRYNSKTNPVPNKFSHNVLMEVIWTIIPVIILVIIAVPSFRTLHYVEHTPKADVTIKVVGYQWYWHYIYPDHGGFEFDSYMIQTADLNPGQKRLLEVDNRVVVPAGKVVRFLTTAADVIHSFAVPAFGIKIDSVPGRTNETWIKVDKPGVYYGQCSELCGVNHGFMPIAVEVVPEEEFDLWVEKAKIKFQ